MAKLTLHGIKYRYESGDVKADGSPEMVVLRNAIRYDDFAVCVRIPDFQKK